MERAATNGIEPTHYQVLQDGKLVDGEVTGLTHTVEGLTNNIKYEFTVQACNRGYTAGDPCGVASNPLPAIPDGIPGPVTDPAAVHGDHKVALTWQKGADNGSPVTGYDIGCSPGCPKATYAATQPSITIDALKNGTPYTFTIAATKTLRSSGQVARSDGTPVSAIPAGKPKAPPGVNATSNDVDKDGTVKVSWTQADANGDAIDHYELAVGRPRAPATRRPPGASRRPSARASRRGPGSRCRSGASTTATAPTLLRTCPATRAPPDRSRRRASLRRRRSRPSRATAPPPG